MNQAEQTILDHVSAKAVQHGLDKRVDARTAMHHVLEQHFVRDDLKPALLDKIKAGLGGHTTRPVPQSYYGGIPDDDIPF